MKSDMTLQEFREEFDRLDVELTRLFARRMELSAQIAAYKRENGLPVLDEAREREKLKAVEDQLPEGLKSYGSALYRTILALSRELQERVIADCGAQERPAP